MYYASLQYDGDVTKGVLFGYDTLQRKMVINRNTTYCWFMEVDPSDPSMMYCLAEKKESGKIQTSCTTFELLTEILKK